MNRFNARWYDPATGTWTQQDTYNAPLSPGNANRYLYAAGDPTNHTDAARLSSNDCFDPSLYCGDGSNTSGSSSDTSNPFDLGSTINFSNNYPSADCVASVATRAGALASHGEPILTGAEAGPVGVLISAGAAAILTYHTC